MFAPTRVIVAVSIALLGISGANAATLNVVGGELVGASDVDVGGTLYDVSFVDGTCRLLFDGCDATSDFTFQSPSSALAAAQALFDQVFIDGPGGAFDSSPYLTRGCSDLWKCYAFTPYTVVSGGRVRASMAINQDPITGIDDYVIDYEISMDYPADADTRSNFAMWVPVPECRDGVDNDGDGLIDAGDPGCSTAADASEQDAALVCDDGIDNDGDNLIDFQDPACKDSSWPRENAQCQDGLDNDNNDGIDFDGGASIFGRMIQPPDPQCGSFWDNREAPNPPPTCGIGPELALLMPLLLVWRSRKLTRP